jgi:glycosyltransferase involved in cell wall biosynthesis
MAPRVSAIINTYNQPRLLDLALRGWARQTLRDWELVIADDGSKPETAALIDSHRQHFSVPLIHVWQPDVGLTRARAVNRALLASHGEVLVFSDGDCIPPPHHLQLYLDTVRPGSFVVGGHIRLDQATSATITPEMIARGDVERLVRRRDRARLWVRHVSSLVHIARHKLRRPRMLGLNFAAARDSVFRVNGFDQTFVNSGKDDSDLRNRFVVGGIRPISLWHRSIVVHLWHPTSKGRGRWKGAIAYCNRENLQPVAPIGLRELAAEIEAERSAGGAPPEPRSELAAS